MKEDIRKLTVTGQGKSYALTLPKWMVQELKWKKGQKVLIELKGGRILVRDWKK